MLCYIILYYMIRPPLPKGAAVDVFLEPAGDPPARASRDVAYMGFAYNLTNYNFKKPLNFKTTLNFARYCLNKSRPF